MKNLKKITSLKTMFVMLLLTAVNPLFAQGDLGQLGLGGLETFAKNIQGIFTGTIVRVILVCCLCGCAIAYAYNKDNEQMKKKVIAIAIGIAVISAASAIVEAVFSASR